ncbi:MAG: MFS transporter [Aquabacterium sp.]
MSLPANAPSAPPAAHRRLMFWVGLLYFSEGLPLGLFYDLFPVHMRQAGVGPAEIGLLSLLGLAWTVKFLWAPLVDARRGHRWWIAGANWGMALVLFAFALSPQAIGPGASWPWALLAAFTVLSATNDIATDGYTIELLAKGQYGMANGLRIGFYRVGMLTAGALLMAAGAFGTPGQANWAVAYGLGGVVMLLNGMALLMAPAQPPRVTQTRTAPSGEWAIVRQQPIWILALGLVMTGLLWPVLGPLAKVAGWDAIKAISGTWWFKGAVPVGLMFMGASLVVVAARDPKAQALADGPVFGAWVSMLSRPGMLGVLLFILLYKLGDTAIGFMIKPFWVDAGFTPAQIGMVSVNVGLGLSILGGLAGGWYVDRAGIFKGLWVFGLAQAGSNLAYAIAAWYVPQGAGASPVALPYQLTVYTASGLESFTQGLGTGAFMAFLMSITHKERATTEYAILSSIFAFSRSVAGWAGGLGVEHLGYQAFFFMTVLLCFPAYLLLPAVRRMLDKAEVR